jgi:hypothetical protein
MLLADMAQVAENKLYVLGGGWHVTSSPSGPCAIAMIVDVEWEETNKQHQFVIELVDADGKPVLLPGPSGDSGALRISGSFEAGRPPGARPGAVTSVPLAVNFAPLPLERDKQFQWRATIDDDINLTATWSFSTRGSGG